SLPRRRQPLGPQGVEPVHPWRPPGLAVAAAGIDQDPAVAVLDQPNANCDHQPIGSREMMVVRQLAANRLEVGPIEVWIQHLWVVGGAMILDQARHPDRSDGPATQHCQQRSRTGSDAAKSAISA